MQIQNFKNINLPFTNLIKYIIINIPPYSMWQVIYLGGFRFENYYIKTNRTFTTLRNYGWILTLLIAIGGLWQPKFLKSKLTGIIFFIFFMFNFSRKLINVFNSWGSFDFLDKLGMLFSNTYLMVLIVGGLMQYLLLLEAGVNFVLWVLCKRHLTS